MATGLVNPATGQVARWKMALDVERCIGCHACSVACKVENKVPLGRFRTKVYYYDQGKFPKVTRNFLPTLCMQCEDTPFLKACDDKAIETPSLKNQRRCAKAGSQSSKRPCHQRDERHITPALHTHWHLRSAPSCAAAGEYAIPKREHGGVVRIGISPLGMVVHPVD